MAITELDILNMFNAHKLDMETKQKADNISSRFEQLAREILEITHPTPEQTVAIRKLMEAKQQTVFALVFNLPLAD